MGREERARRARQNASELGKAKMVTQALGKEAVANAEEMKQQREEQERLDALRHELFYQRVRFESHGWARHGCKKCDGPTELQKVMYCVGREDEHPEATSSLCMVLGDHLHVSCERCGFSWFERCKDDEQQIAGRGGLRHDEKWNDEEREITVVEVPTASQRWSVPDTDPEGYDYHDGDPDAAAADPAPKEGGD